MKTKRGFHDVNQSFHFPSNPRFIFHDSPGFETGDETQLKQVQCFIRERSREWKIDEKLRAIWFFNEERPGNVYDPEMGWQENRKVAEEILETRKPISDFKFPPIACLSMEDMHNNTRMCLNQVKKLTEETAKCLNGSALKTFTRTKTTDFRYFIMIKILNWFPHTPRAVLSRKEPPMDRKSKLSGFEKGFTEEFPWKREIECWIALLICAENSFWHCALGVPYFQALKQSFETYKKSDSRCIVEAAVQDVKLTRDSLKENSSRLIKLLLENRLPRPSDLDVEQ
ncbi:hypothetical protein Clacol_005855 [Clathrus columnatus]|uniref:Uncharacterized protein n=1 Tax=Clathrus columnatus TaxID=1419009 RepID=A0AAV5AG05_9AGAM|nr:hypothetical protein Clacol_005855 [Clathrus columnatus]